MPIINADVMRIADTYVNLTGVLIDGQLGYANDSGVLVFNEGGVFHDIGGNVGIESGSNLGTGSGVFDSVFGTDMRFKSIVGAGTVSIDADASEITISGVAGGGLAFNNTPAQYEMITAVDANNVRSEDQLTYSGGLLTANFSSTSSAVPHSSSLMAINSALNSAISIISGTGSEGRLFFGDSGNSIMCYIAYDHLTNRFIIYRDGIRRMIMDASKTEYNPDHEDIDFIVSGDDATKTAFAVNAGTGYVGLNAAAPTHPLTIFHASNPQVKIYYDISNSVELGVDSVGDVTLNSTGSGFFTPMDNFTYGSNENRIVKMIPNKGVTDNVATSVFRITNSIATGTRAGLYVCNVTALIMNGANSTVSFNASKSFKATFSHALNGAGGTSDSSAVTEIYESASASTGSSDRDIGTVTMSVVNTSSILTDVQFLVDGTGTSSVDTNVMCMVELLWFAFDNAPVITAL